MELMKLITKSSLKTVVVVDEGYWWHCVLHAHTTHIEIIEIP